MVQQQLDKISAIGQEVLALEGQAVKMQEVLANHRALLAFHLWKAKAARRSARQSGHDANLSTAGSDSDSTASSSSTSSTVGMPRKQYTKLVARLDRIAYDVGMLGENMMFKLFSLDGITGDEVTDEVRTARRQQVKEIQKSIKVVDTLRSKALSSPFFKAALAKFTLDVAEEEEEEMGVAEESGDNEAATTTSTDGTQEAEEAEESEDSETEEESKEEEEAEKMSDSEAWKMGLPRWRPQFQQRELVSGALKLFADLGGVDTDSLSLDLNEDTRHLTIKGIKPMQRMHNPFFQQFHAVPHGWFQETFVIPRSLSIDVQYRLEGTRLILTIPPAVPRARSPPTRPKTAFHSHNGYAPLRPRSTHRDYPFYRSHSRSPFDAIFGF